jgi:hypothetical protein
MGSSPELGEDEKKCAMLKSWEKNKKEKEKKSPSSRESRGRILNCAV